MTEGEMNSFWDGYNEADISLLDGMKRLLR